MKPISLNYFTGQMRKVIYVFHSNGNSFDMIFITVIQPKIHKSNGFLRICFQIQNSFLSGHNFKKQPHIFSFNRFQKQSLNIFSKAAARSLKNIEMFLEAATHKKNISCTFSFRSSGTLISFRSSRPCLKKH